MSLIVLLLLVALSLAAVEAPAVEASAPGFRRDVMPMFFRTGCNAGTYR